MSRVILLSLAFAALPSAALVAQPSFDCDDARTATERAICASPGLAELEQRMIGVYRQLVDRVGEDEARRIADIQLERRQACNGDAACIERQLLTSIGIFRAEGQAAVAAESGDDDVLNDLRAALGREAAAPPEAQQDDAQEDDAASRVEERARGIAEGFARLPEYRRRNVQGRLRDAGMLSGPVDGIWGAGSEAAVEALLTAARERGRNFPVQRPVGADALYRFIDSDLFYYEYIPADAR